MKVSVIVPVYNVENYVGKCLDSLIKQSLQEIEILVVDDGSTDQSYDVVKKYADQHKNITVLQKQNGGLSDARNYGLRYAKGEFIAFIDSDDYIDETTLEKFYNKAVQEDLDIVVCDTIMQYEDHSYVLHSNLHYTTDPVRAYIFAHPMACTRFVRKTVMDQFDFEKGIFYEDLNVTPTYVTVSDKVGFLEEPLYYYVQRQASIMNQLKFSEKLLDIFRVLEHVKQVFQEKQLFEKYHDEIEYLYLIHLLRSATLRFLQYQDTEEVLKRIPLLIKKEFPNWKQNPYLKQSNIKFRLVCSLAYKEKYKALRVLTKFQK